MNSDIAVVQLHAEREYRKIAKLPDFRECLRSAGQERIHPSILFSEWTAPLPHQGNCHCNAQILLF